MGKSPESQNTQSEMGFISHLIELRDRLLRSVIAVAIGFAVMFPFANDIYTFLADPLMKHLPEGSSMIAIDVASPFLTPFKLVLMLSVVLAIPYLLHQLWSFIAPGLYKHEKRLALPLLASSVVLFYVGMAFAYFVVFPLVFGFFTSVTPDGVTVMTDINRYLDFVLMMFLAFGIAFEVPVATILVVTVGITTPKKLAKMRPYIIVGAFVVGMFLTPPDVVSQVLLAIPMWILFEAGLWASKYATAHKGEREEDSELAPAAAAGAATAAAPSSMENAISDALIEEEPRYRPMSDEEMEAELDAIEYLDDDDDLIDSDSASDRDRDRDSDSDSHSDSDQDDAGADDSQPPEEKK
jgi:sec-independent protein translocase protein TatC